MSVPDYLKSLEESLKNLMPPNGESASATATATATATASATTVTTTETASPTVPATTSVSPAVQMNLSSAPTSTPSPSETLVSKGLFGVPSSSPGSAAQKKLRFMLVGTHCHQFTGYSKVTYGIVRQLAKLPWLQTIHYGFQKFPQVPPQYRPYPPNVDIIDAAALEKPFQQGFGFAQLPDAIRRKKPDVVMIYNDMTVVTKFLEEIRKAGITHPFKIWLYVDQVYNTQLQAYLDVINRDAERVFVFSKYWRKCLKDQGINRPIDIIRHGFDKDMFSPMKKEEARKMLNLPQDIFLFMDLNRNQPRKRYDLLIMAFVELICKYPTKPLFLMCICDKGEKGGWWLFEIFSRELKLRGVPIDMFGNRLMISSQDMMFRDEDINVFYNIADVGVNSAEGEGWGLCNFEQMGVGIPQVIPDVGGFKDFCNADNSVLVTPTSRYYLPMAYSSVGGEATAVSPHDLCVGMEKYVNDSELREKHGKAARETVLSYKWDECVADLVKRLDEAKKEKEENTD